MTSKLLSWFLNLTRLGVSPDYEDDVSRRIVFSNVVFVSLPVVYFVFMVIDYPSYIIPISAMAFDQFVVPLVIAGCGFSLWLNSKNKTVLSRTQFLLLWPLLMHIVPIKLQQTPLDYYLAFPFGIVFHGMIVQLVFSYKKETKLFALFMSLNLITLILSPSILTYFDVDQDIPKAMIDYKYYFLDELLYWLLFNLVTFYILYIIESYIKKTNESRALIEEQKEELNALNQNLEMLVSQRTAQLEERNEKLRQHAFYNAHLLRGPFSTIKGLIQLQEITESGTSDDQLIRSKLNERLEELDTRIREIQRLVETE